MSCRPATVVATAPRRKSPAAALPPSDPFPFAGLLDPEDLAALGRHVHWKRVSTGELLWREGDGDDCLAIVVRGHLRLQRERAFRDHPLPLGTFGPGSLVADLSFSGEESKKTSALALEETEAVLLSRRDFDRFAAARPRLARQILGEVLRALADQLRRAGSRVAPLL